jgi:hypothetical protein
LWGDGVCDACLGQVQPAQQLVEAGVVAKRIPNRPDLGHEEVGVTHFNGLIEPAKRLVDVSECGVNLREVTGRDEGGFLPLLEFPQYLDRLRAFP